MIDIHSHILPGIDDGANDMHQSISMAKQAVKSGITVLTATPHCRDEGIEQIRVAFWNLRRRLQREGLSIKLCLGMEIYGSWHTAELLKRRKLLTLNASRYPLIEFDFYSDGEEETAILESVLQEGYCPIIAHPERYECVQQNPDIINIWHQMGCLFQLNRGSFTGRFGSRAQRMAFSLVNRRFACVVASDAHSDVERRLWLKDTDELLRQEFSDDIAKLLLIENPKRILKNEEIPIVRPKWF